MLEKARFADSTYGARLFLDEKVAVSRPSARLGASTEITKKEVVSVRVMREVLHRLVIFLSGTIKKMLEKARFADSTYGARLFLDEKVAVSRPSARLGASTEITKKKWCLYA